MNFRRKNNFPSVHQGESKAGQKSKVKNVFGGSQIALSNFSIKDINEKLISTTPKEGSQLRLSQREMQILQSPFRSASLSLFQFRDF